MNRRHLVIPMQQCWKCKKWVTDEEWVVNWTSCHDCMSASFEAYLKEHSMTFEQYQQGVTATWNAGKDPRDRKINATFGVAGEAGEFADLIKKEMFHGVPADPDKVLKELGDVLYYVTAAAIEYGFTLEQVAIANNKKLAARYPNGFVLGGGIREDKHGDQPTGDRLPQETGVTTS